MLVISLPSQSATPRMRVWRALKAAGAAVLRDGVYLLPDQTAPRAAFRDQAHEVEDAGGTAYLVPFESPADEARDYAQLFDRTEQYAELLARIAELKERLVTLSEPEARKRLAQLQRDFDALTAIDYLPGPAGEQAREALAELGTATTATYSPGEPSAVAGEIRKLRIADYRGRTWATRARPWVDRLASAWFIRCFIDPEARILWLHDPKDCPPEALGFDFDGAAFTHIGARVTFEVLAVSFGLAEDRGLARLGKLVHYLDVGGVPVAEAAGVETILVGLRQRLADDDALLAEAGATFDALYAAYASDVSTDNNNTNREQANVSQPPRRRAGN
ncbi:MAG: chromate resistance protein [Sulfuricaulis sp.]|nr:chromate resistance protein [Sulfuricaulis sp.]